jgi:signal transduction histidine kinase
MAAIRLADFILANIEPILTDWEVFARSVRAGAAMDALALRDHAEEILRATTRDMASPQSVEQRSDKAQGRGHRAEGSDSLNGASDLHARARLGTGFDLEDLVSEYRALRASVVRLWQESASPPTKHDVEDLTRFNESIDQSLAKAVSSFTQGVDQARDLFLAILGHDLRNPLNSISMSADLLGRVGDPNVESGPIAAQIATSAQLMARMIGDLLDYTRTRLGAGMPVSPKPMDLGSLCRELVDEFRTAHPSRVIRLAAGDDTRGEWDTDRLRQAVSNLLGNAVQHGAHDVPIDLDLIGEGPDAVIVIVRSGGPTIPPAELAQIFNPLVRGSTDGRPRQDRPGSIGLGLYIAREIARSHGGRIEATSSEEAGTAFTMRLPRHPLMTLGQPILDEQHAHAM